MSAVVFTWANDRLFVGGIAAPVAEIHAHGGAGSSTLPAFVALVHLPGAARPAGGPAAAVRAEVERIVGAWLRSATT